MATLRQFPQEILADETGGPGEREQHDDCLGCLRLRDRSSSKSARLSAVKVARLRSTHIIIVTSLSLLRALPRCRRSMFAVPLYLSDRSQPYRRGIQERAGQSDRRAPRSSPDGGMRNA